MAWISVITSLGQRFVWVVQAHIRYIRHSPQRDSTYWLSKLTKTSKNIVLVAKLEKAMVLLMKLPSYLPVAFFPLIGLLHLHFQIWSIWKRGLETSLGGPCLVLNRHAQMMPMVKTKKKKTNDVYSCIMLHGLAVLFGPLLFVALVSRPKVYRALYWTNAWVKS